MRVRLRVFFSRPSAAWPLGVKVGYFDDAATSSATAGRTPTFCTGKGAWFVGEQGSRQAIADQQDQQQAQDDLVTNVAIHGYFCGTVGHQDWPSGEATSSWIWNIDSGDWWAHGGWEGAA